MPIATPPALQELLEEGDRRVRRALGLSPATEPPTAELLSQREILDQVLGGRIVDAHIRTSESGEWTFEIERPSMDEEYRVVRARSDRWAITSQGAEPTD